MIQSVTSSSSLAEGHVSRIHAADEGSVLRPCAGLQPVSGGGRGGEREQCKGTALWCAQTGEGTSANKADKADCIKVLEVRWFGTKGENYLLAGGAVGGTFSRSSILLLVIAAVNCSISMFLYTSAIIRREYIFPTTYGSILQSSSAQLRAFGAPPTFATATLA